MTRLRTSQAPCILLAARGRGKTAYRQMIAAQCRPMDRDSRTLAITYACDSFERVLKAAHGDFDLIEASHHIEELLRQGLIALNGEAQRDSGVERAMERPHVAPRIAAYQARYAPHLLPDSASDPIDDLGDLSPLELLLGFASLVQDAGFHSCIVLVDGVDELRQTASNQMNQVALLSPLLGTLPLVECPGLAFKFFLPWESESTLQAQEWFRPGRLRIFRIQWDDWTLQELIGQRLTYFSAGGDNPLTQIGQLCEGGLDESIDRELIGLAEGRPRWVIILANTLFWAHCRQLTPPAQIARSTWEFVKNEEWPRRRDDLLRDEGIPVTTQLELESAQATQPASPAAPSHSDRPQLCLDEEKGLVWLREQEIRREIRPKDYSVLVCLYRHRPDVCTKNLIAQEAWSGEETGGVSDQAIASSVARLRRIFRQFAPNTSYIETVKGKRRTEGGYRLHAEGFVG